MMTGDTVRIPCFWYGEELAPVQVSQLLRFNSSNFSPPKETKTS